MTDYYTEHYGPRIGVTGHFTTLSPSVVMKNTEKRSRVRRTSARWIVPAGTDMGVSDVIRLFDMKSSDCLHKLLISSDADFGVAAHFHIGLHKKGDHDDGAVIDADLFAGTIDFAGAIARVDYFNGASGTLDDHHRGQPLWYLADLGAGTYTEDPHEVWTITMTAQENLTVVDDAVSMLAEAYYVTGD